MPRRSVLTERQSLLALPKPQDQLIRHYTLNESDLSLVRQRRGEHNRLGFVVQLLLTAILADAIDWGRRKMAESCPGTTYAKLTWLQAWHIRGETYSAGLAELINAQSRQKFAAYWGSAHERGELYA